ncbi:hypothetical protein M9Y10_005686 [Tritrichomonas musculus]|uniref:Secreted protein n=1 Tax=Tritrichomonas musculus TaxID=1915356 RepID=A0ABR2JCU0_9EUKA
MTKISIPIGIQLLIAYSISIAFNNNNQLSITVINYQFPQSSYHSIINSSNQINYQYRQSTINIYLCHLLMRPIGNQFTVNVDILRLFYISSSL